MNFFPLTTNDLDLIPIVARPKVCIDTKGIVAVKDGNVQAMCVLDSWSEGSCMIHIWIPNPMVLKHGFAQEVFNFVFNTGGRQTIIGATPANNKKAIKFIKHIGFEEVARIPNGYKNGEDLVITTMEKHKCKWIDQPLMAVGAN